MRHYYERSKALRTSPNYHLPQFTSPHRLGLPERATFQEKEGCYLRDLLNGYKGHMRYYCTTYSSTRMSRSTIGGVGDTTIPSPVWSSKQSLSGIGLHDPLHGRQDCPEFTSFHQGMVKYVPGKGYFRAVPSQNGDEVATFPTPPIVKRLEYTSKSAYHTVKKGCNSHEDPRRPGNSNPFREVAVKLLASIPCSMTLLDNRSPLTSNHLESQ